jgi:hypothetical protein
LTGEGGFEGLISPLGLFFPKERLNGLALLSVYLTIDINTDEVIDELAT